MTRNEMNATLATLTNDYCFDIKDPLWSAIRLDKDLMGVYHTPQVQQLHLIKQLGPAYLVYPGAVHTRLCHSLGVYHLAKNIITSLLSRGKGEILSPQGIKDFLCAALLHDVGHFPYAHSLKELPLRDHEALGASLINDDNALHQALIAGGFHTDRICAIIDLTRNTDDKEIQYYRTLLSGSLDPDKLDYLTRDAYFTGVPYGTQDYEYIISHLTITKEGKSALLYQAESSLEQVLFSKYQMYQAVYWHEKVRCATAMIRKPLARMLSNGSLKPEQLYSLDDYSFYYLALQNKQELSNVIDVTFNRLLPCRFEQSFDKNGKIESIASDITKREKVETALYEQLRKNHPDLLSDQIIIDIPEPISFEANIPLVLSDGSTVSFAEHDQLFQDDVKSRFISTLRKTRIFAPEYINKHEINEALKYV